MSPANCNDWIDEDEFYCAHCLTELDRWATRCYRCNASFHGADRFHLLSGKPNISSVLYHG